jgi:hypothetical protein
VIRRGAVLLLAAAAATSVQAAASQPRAPVALNGTATLLPVDLAGQCMSVDVGDATVVECARGGAFAGKPVRGKATYTWHWHLWRGGETPQTAQGDEDGIAVLRLGTRGVLRLTMRGKKLSGLTTGTWRFRSGTKQFAGRRGTGTYRFETVADGTRGFRTSRLVLRGSLR